MIVDDDPVARSAYGKLIGAQDDMQVVGEAESGLDALRKLPGTRPNVVLMDLHMPAMDGVEATRKMVAKAPDVRVLVVTIFDQPEDVEAAVAAGASGFVIKNSPVRDLLRAVRLVGSGQGVLSPEVTGGVLDMLRGSAQDSTVKEIETGLGVPVSLTQRESEVLRLIAMGKTNSEIADELFLAPTSVKTYVSRLRAKLKARSRAELVTLYYVNSAISDAPGDGRRQVPVFGRRSNSNESGDDPRGQGRSRWRA
ncbi:response regulator [Actinomyces glycerinitolerans]|uniref:response regulator n=1 Tax=Actinomyces glycerinitolerans TaxID=1892869 RepID=UPI0009F8D37E|nr:response regulator transcription factor [Actinomyces glycerinitolerans]